MQGNALAQQASGYPIVKKYFHIRKLMQAKAKLPVDAIGLTAQTGLTSNRTSLTAQTAGDTNSAMKDDSITKADDQEWGFL